MLQASARIDVKPPVQSSTAWDGIVYITVEADPSLTASDPVADRAGDFKLVLTATSQSAGSVPCGDYISITMGSGSGWGSYVLLRYSAWRPWPDRLWMGCVCVCDCVAAWLCGCVCVCVRLAGSTVSTNWMQTCPR